MGIKPSWKVVTTKCFVNKIGLVWRNQISTKFLSPSNSDQSGQDHVDFFCSQIRKQNRGNKRSRHNLLAHLIGWAEVLGRWVVFAPLWLFAGLTTNRVFWTVRINETLFPPKHEFYAHSGPGKTTKIGLLVSDWPKKVDDSYSMIFGK